MNQIRSLAKRELKAYFLSPVALIFLGTFLFVTLFTVFWVEAFFARGIADVRPLFEWLPVLLIFLVAALSMRLWSEEQKLGTLELLLTTPVPISRLVLGKFFGGLGLVALALALTFGLPVTVANMGDLDWGPVFGGYLAALLLAAAYLAIGLCISAATENQIIALIGTVGTCGVLHALGSEPVTAFAGNRLGEVLRAIGTGSRFQSIERGVVDLRDLLYDVSLTAIFLLLNVLLLERKRWSQGHRTADRRRNGRAFVALVAANLVALNVVAAPFSGLRLDLTERDEYSVSDVTKDMLRSLDSPLLIRGYFSAKTHPLLAPFVPRIRDLIAEYEVLGGGKVQGEMVDPRDDEKLEEEANQSYGIKSFPFKISDRYEAAIVNSYFSILIKYGDKYEVLGFDDLIEVQVVGEKVDVRLRNLEYDLTRAIKKAVYGFRPIEAAFAEIAEDVEFTGYVTPATLPENFRELPQQVEKVAADLAKRSNGKLKWSMVDPTAPDITQDLFKKFGFRPFATSIFGGETFYFHLVLRVGETFVQVVPGESMSEADIREQIESAIRRAVPGFMKTVGLVKPKVEMPDYPPQFQQQRPPEDPTRALRELLSQTYEVRDVDPSSGTIPAGIDVLVVVSPKDYDEKKQFAIDQFLMRGGAVIVLGGKYELATEMSMMGELAVHSITTGLEDLIAAYGLKFGDKMVMDRQSGTFPIPVVRALGGFRVRDIQLIPYPFFVDVRSNGMGEDHPALAGLSQITLPWVTPIEPAAAGGDIQAKEGEAQGPTITTLLRSSEESWLRKDTDIQPNFELHGELGFPTTSDTGAQSLAVAVQGRIESAFKNRPSPLFGEGQEGDRTGRTLKQSPEGTRLVVVGSSAFVNDQIIGLSRQTGSEGALSGLQFVANLVDWSVEDVDLLTIRSRGAFARTLEPMKTDQRAFWELANYGLVVLALGAIVLFTWTRRRRVQPIVLEAKASVGGAA